LGVFQIDVGDIVVQAERKKVKCIRLYIKPPDGRVYVSMPMRCSIASVREFVESKRGWIKSKQEQCRVRDAQSSAAQQSENSVLLWGERCQLTVEENARNDGAEIVGGGIVVRTKQRADQETVTAVLDELYRAQLLERLPEVAEKWQRIMRVEASEWRTKKMKTRWGTCNVDRKRIWINVRLAMLPPECLDAVAVHELCHFFESGHNRKFYSLMDKYYPDWHYADVRLKELSGVLQ